MSEGFNASFVEDPVMMKLKNSMVLIERDLGIGTTKQEEEDEDLHYHDVSSVIHRSMASLEGTPIANRINTTLSESMCNDSMLGSENQMTANIFELKDKE